jgi:hypothetical protein
MKQSKTAKGLALDALAEKVKRRKAKEAVHVGVRLPSDMLQGIDLMARELKCNRSDMIRLLLDGAIAETLADVSDQFRRVKDKLC